MTAKDQTWAIIKRDPELVAWVKEDPELQNLLAACVAAFGVIDAEMWNDEKQGRRDRETAVRLFNWFASQGSHSPKRAGHKGRL
jgi:hypothetical protein